MNLEIDIRHALGASFELAVRFAVHGPATALWGPSGAGKTTVANVIAGLIRPDRGRIALDGEVLVDRAQGVFVAPERRRIGYVFQDGRLFPHLTVRQNLLYGRMLTPRAQRSAALDDVVGLLDLGLHLGRRPGLLSGGEKQRVAIGRALLSSPRLLLMDEPLASLDIARREEILPYIERLRDQAGVPIVYISHVRDEVERLASTVVRLDRGEVVGIDRIGRPPNLAVLG
jgi:molybdate transport system ATP-binding protein